MHNTQNVEIDRSDWSRDRYRGSAEDLFALGVLTPQELEPHERRAPGYTVFLPNGEPCPPNRRAWRDPGFKSVFRCDNGEYIVEITVSRQEQQIRRSAQREAEHERREQILNTALAEQGTSLVPQRLKHDIGRWCESWEGTKAQLQAAGIGVGVAFPGELGAAKNVTCTCPLGFQVEISPHYEELKAAAGVFRAISRYLPCGWDWTAEVTAFAPGVTKEVRPIDRTSMRYVGTAHALVAAGLVPSIDLFPGQPGRNKQRCSYRKDLSPSTNANAQTWAFTILRRGKERFEVDVPFPPDEAAERDEKYKQLCAEHEAEEAAARKEREQLRAANASDLEDEGVPAFRDKAEHYVEWGLRMIELAFTDDKTLYTYDGEVMDELSGAFAAIRDAVHNGVVLKNSAVAERLEERRRAIAAKTDAGLQTFLREVQSRPVRG